MRGGQSYADSPIAEPACDAPPSPRRWAIPLVTLWQESAALTPMPSPSKLGVIPEHRPRLAVPVARRGWSNEAALLYQLWVREFGINNLPDCPNLCHEASGGALTAALGTGNVTVDLRRLVVAKGFLDHHARMLSDPDRVQALDHRREQTVWGAPDRRPAPARFRVIPNITSTSAG
jgi:hypothetical protein